MLVPNARPTQVLVLVAIAAAVGIVVAMVTAPPAARNASSTPRPATPAAVSAPAVKPATGQVLVGEPATDNYKASFNVDPARPEHRTWLSVRFLETESAVYLPADGQHRWTNRLHLRGSDGSKLVAALSSNSNNVDALIWRDDSATDGIWGPVLTLRDRARLRQAPVAISIILIAANGTPVATERVVYRFDSAIARASRDSLEWNGPGGRWLVDGSSTLTNVDIDRTSTAGGMT